MANKKRGEIEVELGGKTRIMKLTMNDFAELMDLYGGEPLLDLLGRLDKLDVRVLRSMLWLALKHEDKDLTEKQVGDWNCSLTWVAQTLGECISAALEGDKPAKKK